MKRVKFVLVKCLEKCVYIYDMYILPRIYDMSTIYHKIDTFSQFYSIANLTSKLYWLRQGPTHVPWKTIQI